MTSGNILLLILIACSLIFFSIRLRQIISLINLGQAPLSMDAPLLRLRTLLTKGFGQRNVLRDISGVGHAVIFWGFLFFFLGTVESLLIGVYQDFSFSFLGPIYTIFNSGQDIFGILILAALLASIYRRVILRPARLEAPLFKTIDAFIVLSLITVLIVCYYGAAAVAPKPGWTPVSDMLRFLFYQESVASESTLQLQLFFEWSHHLVVLSFLAYILYSKHSHIIFALPNIFLKENSPQGQIEKLDLSNEEGERFGAKEITDFSKKGLLELFSCTECGRCQDSCPAYNTGKDLSPKKLMLNLKDSLLDQKKSLLHTGSNTQPVKPLYPDTIDHDMLWSCSTCSACAAACPVDNSPMDKIISIRQERVLMEGDFPEEAKNALKNIEAQSNPWGLPQADRANWAKDMNVKILSQGHKVDYLLFIGCAGAYDQRYISVSRALVRLLQKAGINFGILGEEEQCTGDSARRLGNDYLAQELAESNIETFHRYGIKKIITSCPHCFNTIKNDFPQHGGNFEVIHHSTVINHLIITGKIKLSFHRPQHAHRIVFHDSCYLGRYNKIIDAPRDIIGHIGGQYQVEATRNRENGFCCGAGGGRMWMEDTKGTAMNVERTRELLATGAQTIATSCPFCLNMIQDGLKQEKSNNIQLLDIAEIVDNIAL